MPYSSVFAPYLQGLPNLFNQFQPLTIFTITSNFQYKGITSPPVFVGNCLPSKLLIEVLSSVFDNMRLVDKFLPPAILQHHLQLCESILAFQATLII